jgi:acyl CoA:acetate/3-ketoacid CoA transferase beta subunit
VTAPTGNRGGRIARHRAARELLDRNCINLGTGTPTLVASFTPTEDRGGPPRARPACSASDLLREVVPGTSARAVQARTEPTLLVAPDLSTRQL